MTVVVEAVDRADQVVQILQADHGALQRGEQCIDLFCWEDLRAIDREALDADVLLARGPGPVARPGGADLRRTWHLLQTLLALLALEIFLLLLLDRAGVGAGLGGHAVRCEQRRGEDGRAAQ